MCQAAVISDKIILHMKELITYLPALLFLPSPPHGDQRIVFCSQRNL